MTLETRSDPAQPAVQQALAVLERARAALLSKREVAHRARAFAVAAQVRVGRATGKLVRAVTPGPANP